MNLITGERVRQADQVASAVQPGTLMQKVIPPRLVEPYLTSRRAVIAGFVYLARDSSFTDPADFYEALDLGYEGSEFGAEMPEVYVMRWSAVGGPYARLVGRAPVRCHQPVTHCQTPPDGRSHTWPS